MTGMTTVSFRAKARAPLVTGIAAFVMSAPACNSSPGGTSTKAGLAHLDSTIAGLSSQVSDLQERLRAVEWQATLDQVYREKERNAQFDPAANEGFSRLDTSLGTFAVSLEDVQPFADGVRVRFLVGNLTAATVTAATLKVKWGTRLTPSVPYKRWKESLQEREVKVADPLKPGIWNNVSVTLPGTKAENLGYVELSMDTGQISLQPDR